MYGSAEMHVSDCGHAAPRVIFLAELVAKMNADEARRQPVAGRHPQRWRLRNVKKVLQAGGVHVLGGWHERKFFLETDLRFAWPEFFQAMQDAEEEFGLTG